MAALAQPIGEPWDRSATSHERDDHAQADEQIGEHDDGAPCQRSWRPALEPLPFPDGRSQRNSPPDFVPDGRATIARRRCHRFVSAALSSADAGFDWRGAACRRQLRAVHSAT